MNNVLLIFAVLSLGAVVVATYVFTVAARNYVSDSSDDGDLPEGYDDINRELVSRSSTDRRQRNNVIDFPIRLTSGDVVYRDRRVGERRSAG